MALSELEIAMAVIRRIETSSYEGVYHVQQKITGALGAYQIMPDNWPSWAAQAGIPGARWQDPAAQDAVARFKMMEYYRRYGSWDLVAMAWFSGEDTVRRYLQGASVGSRSDVTGTSVDKYLRDFRRYWAEFSSRASPIPQAVASLTPEDRAAYMAGREAAPGDDFATGSAASASSQAGWYFPVYLDPNDQLARWFGQLTARPPAETRPQDTVAANLRNMLTRMSEAVKQGAGGPLGAPPSDRVDLSKVMEVEA